MRRGYEQGAKSFGLGATNWFEVVHMGQSGDLAYWVGYQRATSCPFNLRVSEIFRCEGSERKLIHRHADPLQTTPEG